VHQINSGGLSLAVDQVKPCLEDGVV
jgi:hypothetical protein